MTIHPHYPHFSKPKQKLYKFLDTLNDSERDFIYHYFLKEGLYWINPEYDGDDKS